MAKPSADDCGQSDSWKPPFNSCIWTFGESVQYISVGIWIPPANSRFGRGFMWIFPDTPLFMQWKVVSVCVSVCVCILQSMCFRVYFYLWVHLSESVKLNSGVYMCFSERVSSCRCMFECVSMDIDTSVGVFVWMRLCMVCCHVSVIDRWRAAVTRVALQCCYTDRAEFAAYPHSLTNEDQTMTTSIHSPLLFSFSLFLFLSLSLSLSLSFQPVSLWLAVVVGKSVSTGERIGAVSALLSWFRFAWTCESYLPGLWGSASNSPLCLSSNCTGTLKQRCVLFSWFTCVWRDKSSVPRDVTNTTRVCVCGCVCEYERTR